MYKLKGTTEIELRNAKTGKLEEYIKEQNLVTNAVSKLAKFGLNHSYATGESYTQGMASNIYDEHLNLFSGLVLFDSQITESADNIWLPAGVKPVGYGNQSVYSDDYQMMGDYSSGSSEYIAGESIKRVWIFKPKHANATISCVCLTSLNAGYYGFGGGGESDDVLSTLGSSGTQGTFAISAGTIITQTEYGVSKLTNSGDDRTYANIPMNSGVGDFAIDSDNDVKYQFRVMSNKLQIITHKMTPDYFDVFNGVQVNQVATVEEYAGTFSGGSWVTWFYNTDEKILYFWITNSTSQYATGTQIAIHKFDVVNKVLTTDWKIFTNNSGIPCSSCLAVTNTAVYYTGKDDYRNGRIRKYTFSNATTTVLSTLIVSTLTERKPYILNGIIEFGFLSLYTDTTHVYSRGAIVDTSDDSVRFSPNYFSLSSAGTSYGNGYPNFVPPYDVSQPIFGMHVQAGAKVNNIMSMELSTASMGGNCIMLPNYLATINNLSSPVTKTETQTMTISYTLSKAEE